MRTKLIWFTLLLIWMTAALVGYYVFHKPLDLGNIHAIATTAYSLATATGIISVSVGVGRGIHKKVSNSSKKDIPALMLEFGLGFGLSGLAWLALAAGGLLWNWLAWLILIASLIGLRHFIIGWWQAFFTCLQSLRPTHRLDRFLAIGVGILSLMTLIEALGPPYAWDTLLYHLTSPLRHIEAGRLTIDPNLPESGYPQLFEMHYTWLLLLGTPRAAAVVHWFMGLMTGCLVWWFAHEWTENEAGWVAVSLLFSAGTYTKLMGVAYIDLGLIFYTTLAFRLLIDWLEEPATNTTILMGLMAGFGFGIKYTGAITGVALVILMIWRRPRRTFQTLAAFGGAAFLVSLPWLMKNLQVGNPFYPFLGEGLGWDAIRQAWYSQVGSGLLRTDPAKLLTAPVIMTIIGAEGAETWHATFGPLMLMLAPALFLGWIAYRDRSWFRYGLVFIGLLYAAWLYGAAISRLLIQPRLLFPMLPTLAWLLAASYLRFAEVTVGPFSMRRIFDALLILVLLLTLFSQISVFLNSQALEVVLGWESSEDFLYQHLGWYHAAIRSLESLPEQSQVIFLFEPRTYYCPIDRCIPDGVLDRWHWLRQRGLDNEAILAEWSRQGVSHVLIYQLGVDVLQQGDDQMANADWEALESLIANNLAEVENFGNAYVLYQIAEP